MLLYFLLAVGPLDGRLPDMAVRTPENFQLIASIAAGISITLSNVIATGIGISVRQRREHEHEIAAWAARAQRLGSVTERNRIAREMHDVVAHSLTVMVSLSDGAAVVVQKDPDARRRRPGRTLRAPDAPRWRTCGACSACCATTPPPDTPRASRWWPEAAWPNCSRASAPPGLPLHYTHTGPSLPAMRRSS